MAASSSGDSASLSPRVGKSSHAVVYDNRKKVYVVRQYILGDMLGQGSYARVHEAIDSVSLRRVAIKVIKRSAVRKKFGRTAETNLQQEIAIMKRLRGHPNIVGTIDVFENPEKKKIYIVLEYVCGGSLLEVMERQRGRAMPASQIQHYARQIVNALEYIHGAGVVHRDLKPGNIMVDLDHNLKVFDFGVSQILNPFHPRDTCAVYLGTPAFQPPEVALCAPRFSGFKSDVWALGVTMFYLATGDYPFTGANVFNLLDNIGRGEYEIPESVDPLLRELIAGMLEVDVNLRYDLHTIKRHPWMVTNDVYEGLPDEDARRMEPWFDVPRDRIRPSALPFMEIVLADHEERERRKREGDAAAAKTNGSDFPAVSDSADSSGGVKYMSPRSPYQKTESKGGDESGGERSLSSSSIRSANSSRSNSPGAAATTHAFISTDETSSIEEYGGVLPNETNGGKSSILWSRRRQIVEVSQPKEMSDVEEEDLAVVDTPDAKRGFCSIQ